MLTTITISRQGLIDALNERLEKVTKAQEAEIAKMEAVQAKAWDKVLVAAARFGAKPTDKTLSSLTDASNLYYKYKREATYDRNYAGHHVNDVKAAIELVKLSDQPTFKVNSRTEFGRALGL